MTIKRLSIKFIYFIIGLKKIKIDPNILFKKTGIYHLIPLFII